jgi:hypothetical protein
MLAVFAFSSIVENLSLISSKFITADFRFC